MQFAVAVLPELMLESTSKWIWTKVSQSYGMIGVQVVDYAQSFPKICIVDLGAIVEVTGVTIIVKAEFLAIL